MNLVNLEAAVKAYGTAVLLDGVSLGVAAGERIGVVGRNGAGKTTLLEALAGRGDPNAGRSTRSRDAQVGYLPQAEQLTRIGPGACVRRPAEHEWAADARGARLLAAPAGRHRPRRQRGAAVRRRAPPGRAGRAAARHPRPAAARRADQPPGHRGDRLAGRVPDAATARRSSWSPTTGGSSTRCASGPGRSPTARCTPTTAATRRTCWPGPSGPGSAAAQDQRRRNLLRKELAWLRRGPPARTCKPKFRIDAAERADRRRARRRGTSVELSRLAAAPARQDRRRPDRRHASRSGDRHAARRRHLAARARRPGRRRRRQRHRQDHAAAAAGRRLPARPPATVAARS